MQSTFSGVNGYFNINNIFETALPILCEDARSNLADFNILGKIYSRHLPSTYYIGRSNVKKTINTNDFLEVIAE